MALSLSGRKLAVEVGGCLAALVFGVVALKFYTQYRHEFAAITAAKLAPAASQPAADVRKASIASGSRRAVELVAGDNGHFFADADINGRSVSVMVDTGASIVALTYEDAQTAGLSVRDSDFTQQANTANGIAKMAPVTIDRLSIGGVEVRNVRAAVMESGKLNQTLLGMSFIKKLSRFDMQSGRLIIEE
jgi:aspartyl protease family protein